MGYELRRWLAEVLPPDLPAGERLIAYEIADRASDDTRECSSTREELARWCGLTVDSFSELLRRLAVLGWEFRKVIGKGADGRPLFTRRGAKMRFTVPEFPPSTYGTGPGKGPTAVGPKRAERVQQPSDPKRSRKGPTSVAGKGPTAVGPKRGRSMPFNPQSKNNPPRVPPQAHRATNLDLIIGEGSMTRPRRMPGQRSLTMFAVDDPPIVDGRSSTVLGGWIDYCRSNGVELPKRVIGMYAKRIKTAQDEGFPDNTIKWALAKMLTDGNAGRPSLLDGALVDVQAPRRTAGRLGPDADAERIIALGRAMAANEHRQLEAGHGR